MHLQTYAASIAVNYHPGRIRANHAEIQLLAKQILLRTTSQQQPVFAAEWQELASNILLFGATWTCAWLD